MGLFGKKRKGQIEAIPALSRDRDDMGHLVIRSSVTGIQPMKTFLQDSQLAELTRQGVDVRLTDDRVFIQGVGIKQATYREQEEQAQADEYLKKALGALGGTYNPNHEVPHATVTVEREKSWLPFGKKKGTKKGRGYGKSMWEE